MLKFVTDLLKLMPAVIQMGSDMAPIAQRLIDVVRHRREPTDADWKYLADIEKALRSELYAPETD